jgi:hypothetical protein
MMKTFGRYGYPEAIDQVPTLKRMPLEYKLCLNLLVGLWNIRVLDSGFTKKEVKFVDPHQNTTQCVIMRNPKAEYWINLECNTISIYGNEEPYNQLTLVAPDVDSEDTNYYMPYEDTVSIMESIESAMNTLIRHRQLTKTYGYCLCYYEIRNIMTILGLEKEFSKRLEELGFVGAELDRLKRENREYAFEEWKKEGFEI